MVVTAKSDVASVEHLLDDSVYGGEVSIEDLVSIRDIQSLVVSPDERHVAFQVDQADPQLHGYTSAWYATPVTAGSGARVVSSAGAVNIYRTPRGDLWGGLQAWPVAWSPDGQWLAYLHSAEGGTQIWRAPLQGDTPEQVTQNDSDVIEFTWAPDGSSLYFLVGRERHSMASVAADERRRGILFSAETVDPHHGAARLWTRCESMERRFSMIRHYSAANRCEPTVWVYDFLLDVERRASATEVATYLNIRSVDSSSETIDGAIVRSVTHFQENGLVAWLENLSPTTNSSIYPPLTVAMSHTEDRRNPIHCTDPACTGRIKNLWWRRTTGEVLFHGWESDGVEVDGLEVTRPSVSILYAWTPVENSVRTVLRTDDAFTQCAIAGDRLICLYDTWTWPTRIVAIDLDSGGIETVFDANPEFAAFDFTRIEKINSTDESGYKAIGHFVYPAGYEEGKRYPLVIVGYVCSSVVGSSFLRGGTGDELPIHVLAQRGFAVLCYSMPLMPARIPQLPLLEQMITQLDSRGLIDPARIGISGFSAGGGLVEDSIVNSDRFAAASAAWSPTHPANYYLLHQESARRRAQERGGGEALFDGLEYWSRTSPGVNADKVRTPLLLQVADVEIFHSLPNYLSLEDAGKPVEMYVFPDASHVKTQPAHKYAVYKRNLQWFNFWLQGVEEPDPLDPEQYTRWRTMRDDHCMNMQAERREKLPSYCGSIQ